MFSQASSLVVKNTTLLLRSRVMTLLLLLFPPLFTVILGLVDTSLNAPPAVDASPAPFLTLSDDKAIECQVFDSDLGAYGLGVPIPNAWCAPMIYSPSTNPQVRTVMKTVAERSGWKTAELSGAALTSNAAPEACATSECALGFETSADLSTWLASNLGRAATAIAFKRPDGNGSLVDLGGSTLPDSSTFEIWFNQSAVRYYMSNGYDKLASEFTPSQLQMAAQHIVEEAILALKLDSKTRTSLSLRNYPSVPRKDLVDGVKAYGGIFFFVPLMLPMVHTLNLMVGEKELGMLGMMRQLGLRESVWWGSFLLQAAVLLFVSACTMYVIGSGMGIAFFSMTDFSVILATFWLFGMASMGGACVLAALISRTRVSNIATFVLLVFGLIVSLITGQLDILVPLLHDPTVMPGGGFIIALLQIVYPPLAFAKARFDIATVTKRVPVIDPETKLTSFATDKRYSASDLTEGNYTGTQTSIAQTLDTPVDSRTYVLPPTNQALIFMAVCMLCGVLLAAYLLQVLPGGHGRGEPWYFPFSPRYWLPSSRVQGNPILQARLKAEAEERHADLGKLDVDVAAEARRVLEGRTPAERKVVLLDLHKRFGKFKAVDGVSLSLAEGEVFALLGHNGAGKSTTINLCTGSLVPSSGDAIVYGRSVNHDTAAVRALMGLCPQHDVLFEQLTALEHLRLFGRFKGVPKEALERDIPVVLEAVKLTDVQNKAAGKYSGGMKRRLSVAIAYIGEPSLIVLDEPTTGMDPYNRKFVWAMIEERRKGRTTLLTTHSMEEADALGQEIAIMSHGQLVAFGSSMRLKRRFGAGYSLRLVTPFASAPALRAQVQSLLPEATLVDDSAGSLTFAISEEAMKASAPLLRYIESLQATGSSNGGVGAAPARLAVGCAGLVSSMGARLGGGGSEASPRSQALASNGGVVLNDWLITHTTLEEVFIRLARAEEATDDKAAGRKEGRGCCCFGPYCGCGRGSGSSTEVDKAKAAEEFAPATEHAAIDVTTDYTPASRGGVSATGKPRALRATVRKNLTLFRRQRVALACSIGLPLVVIVVGALLQALLIDRRQANSLLESEAVRQHLIDSCAKVTELFDTACKERTSLRTNGVCEFCATPKAEYEFLDACCERKLEGINRDSQFCMRNYQPTYGSGGGGGSNVAAEKVNQCGLADGNDNWQFSNPPNFATDCQARNSSSWSGDFNQQDYTGDEWTSWFDEPAYCNCTDGSGKRSIALQERIDATPMCAAYNERVLGRLTVNDVAWVPNRLEPGALDNALNDNGGLLGWRVPTFSAKDLGFGKLAGANDKPLISRSNTSKWASYFQLMPAPAYARATRNNDDYYLSDNQEEAIVDLEGDVTKSGLAVHFPYALGRTKYSRAEGQQTVPCFVTNATTKCCFLIDVQYGAVRRQPIEQCSDDGSCPFRFVTDDDAKRKYIQDNSIYIANRLAEPSELTVQVSDYYILGVGTLDDNGRPAQCVNGEPPICIDIRAQSSAVLSNATCESLFGDSTAFEDARSNWTLPYNYDSGAYNDARAWQCVNARCVNYEQFVVPSYAPAGFADQAALDKHILDQQNLVRAGAYVGGADGVEVDDYKTRLSLAEYLFPSWSIDITELEASKGVVSWTMSSFFKADKFFYAHEPFDQTKVSTLDEVVSAHFSSDKPYGLRSWGGFSGAPQTWVPLMLQNAFSNAMLRDKLGEEAHIRVGLRPMPSETLGAGDMLLITYKLLLDIFILLVVPLATSMLLPTFTNSVVQEKQLKLRSLMMMMGLPASSYWLVEWSFDSLISHTAMGLFWGLGAAAGLRYFKRSLGALFFIFQVWAQLQIAIGVLLSCAFNNTRTASIVTYLVVIGSAIGGLIMWLQTLTPGAAPWNPAVDVYPLFAFYHCVFLATQKGITLGALTDTSEPVCLAFWLMVVHTAWMLPLGLYLDAVLPREFGLPQHPLFCFSWCSGRRAVQRERAASSAGNGPQPSAKLNRDHVPEKEDPDVASERAKVEKGHYDRDTPIQVFSLRKVYAGGKVAINNLTFTIWKDECFGLLGPNGAGKSTTISVLTGLFRPTSGTATIGGHDILTQMGDIYRKMGVCPQFDILWPNLTVREHMLFYSRLKGVEPKGEKAAAEAAANAVGLGFKLDSRIATLSGGQKRRVSLGISLIGSPDVVFLDEPTTGLDPETRRLMWQLVERSKAGRVIVLTTHSMEEADALCGRIGIMANGELRCLGTNVHLKTTFGDGYKVDVAHEPGTEKAAHAFMMSLLPTATVASSFAASKTYAVRRAETSIATVFERMAGRPASAGILDWSLRQTSLEEVFLKIAREAMNDTSSGGHGRRPSSSKPSGGA